MLVSFVLGSTVTGGLGSLFDLRARRGNISRALLAVCDPIHDKPARLRSGPGCSTVPEAYSQSVSTRRRDAEVSQITSRIG